MKSVPMASVLGAESEEMEEDDNGVPRCGPLCQVPEESVDDRSSLHPSGIEGSNEGDDEEDGEDDNGVYFSSIREDNSNAIDLQSSTQEKHEDPGGTKQDGSFEHESTIKLDERQSAETSSGDQVSLNAEGQRNVSCGAGQVAESSSTCTLETSNSSSHDDVSKNIVLVEGSVDTVNRAVPKASTSLQEDFNDLMLTEEQDEGSSRPRSDEIDVRECIRGSQNILEDQRGSEKTPDDERKTLNIEGSLIDSDKKDTDTDQWQTEEDKEADFFATGTGIPPSTIRKEDTSPGGRETLTVPYGGRTEELDPGPSRDGRKGCTDLRNRERNAKKTARQSEVGSSEFGEGGHSERDDNNHSTKSARVSSASSNLNFTKFSTILVSVVCLAFSRGVTALTVIPGDVLASSGSIARLRCSTNYPSPVYWERKLFGSDEQETIYYGKNGMARIAGDRIRIDEDSTSGHYDLVISDVQLEDAGTYTCIDEAGIGEAYKAELVVSERFTCEMPVPPYGFMGENIFDIPEDQVVSTCSLTFRGNSVPRFQWTWGKVTSLVAATVINDSAITSSLSLRATHDMNGARLTWLPILSAVATSTDDSPLRWTSEPVPVRYVHVTFGSVECQSNAMIPVCNPNCTYEVQPTSDNNCQCLAVYNDRGRTYSKVFNEHLCAIQAPVSSTMTVVVIIATLIAVTAAGIAIALLGIKCLRKKPGGESQETLEHLEGEEKIIPQNDASYTRENEMQIQPIIKLTDRN